MKKMHILLAVTLLLGLNPALRAEELIQAGAFSKAVPEAVTPEKWEPFTFDNIDTHTSYQLVRLDGAVVVKAVTNQSASGLIRKMRIDLNQYPVIEWRWRIENIYETGNAKKKSGDDYPARIYIAFQYDPDEAGFFEKVKFEAIKAIHGEYPPAASINYIWGSQTPVGETVPNPYTERVQMIVVDSGKEKTGTWVKHTRNVYEDYTAAFGQAPPPVSGIAIMSDSDNTKESATAYYGDIIFKKR